LEAAASLSGSTVAGYGLNGGLMGQLVVGAMLRIVRE